MLPHAKFWKSDSDRRRALPAPTNIVPFAGRIGANQEFSLDQNNCTQIELLQKFPDAAPWIPWRDALSLRHFFQPELWKAATIEAVGPCAYLYEQLSDLHSHFIRHFLAGIFDLLHRRGAGKGSEVTRSNFPVTFGACADWEKRLRDWCTGT